MAKMGDSDSGIGVGTGTGSKFYQFGAGIGTGINFFYHVGIGVGIGIRIMDRNRNRSRNRVLWNQSMTPESLLIMTTILINMESEPESESEELESEPESEPWKYFKVESESESESECKGGIGIGVGAGTIRNRPSLIYGAHFGSAKNQIVFHMSYNDFLFLNENGENVGCPPRQYWDNLQAILKQWETERRHLSSVQHLPNWALLYLAMQQQYFWNTNLVDDTEKMWTCTWCSSGCPLHGNTLFPEITYYFSVIYLFGNNHLMLCSVKWLQEWSCFGRFGSTFFSVHYRL